MLRRTFMQTLAASSAAAILSGCPAWMRPNNSISQTFNRHEKETMEAIADTVLPNIDGSPGAVEAGAWEVFKDPFYHINPWIQEIVSDIDWTTRFCFGKKNFKSCDLATRTKILENRLEHSLYKKVYHTIVLMAKLAFFGGIINTVGYDYIGFPGESNGYRPA